MENSNHSNIVDIIREKAQHQPEKIVFTYLSEGEAKQSNLSYGDLDRKARSIAVKLQEFTVPGQRVLMLYPPGLDFITALFACFYAGVIAVPLYPPEPTRLEQTIPRFLATAKDAQSEVVLTNQMVLSFSDFLFQMAPELKKLNWMATDQIDGETIKNWKKPELDKNTLALLMYTSGSTGTPKGVMLKHENLIQQYNLLLPRTGLNSSDTGVGWLPPYHITGLFLGIIFPIIAGIPTIFLSPLEFLESPLRWLKAISINRATLTGSPIFGLDLCIRKIPPEERSNLDLSSLKMTLVGSEAIRSDVLDQFAEYFKPCGFKRQSFYPGYGLTETTGYLSSVPVPDPYVVKHFFTSGLEENRVLPAPEKDQNARALVGHGKLLPDTKVLIVNPETLTPCPSDQIGEIWVSGPCVAQGYWNRPQENQETFQAYLEDTKEGPFLRTGDLGFFLDGELFITGRSKDMILVRGVNYYPEDIEKTLENVHPNIRTQSSAAFAVEIGGEEKLVIVQEIDPLSDAEMDQIIDKIRESVSLHHKLHTYAVSLVKRESIPRTVTRKIQRQACRQAFLTNKLEVLRSHVFEQDPSQIEERKFLPAEMSRADFLNLEPQKQKEKLQAYLQNLVAFVLKVSSKQIDFSKPIITLGLDSLMAMELKNRVEKLLEIPLPMVLFLRGPNVLQMTHVLLKQMENTHEENIESVKIPRNLKKINYQKAKALFPKLDELSDRQVDTVLEKIVEG